MIIQNSTDDKRIKNFRKTSTVGENGTTWESVGFNDFIVLVGDSNEHVIIKDESSAVYECLKSIENELVMKDAISIPLLPVTAYRVSFAQLKQQGGFSANGKPGVYAVYGVDISDNNCTIYIQDNNVLQVTINVTIDIAPVTLTKRRFVFKTENVYSGYKKISIEKPVLGISGSSLYYMVGTKQYKYPFPDDILKTGGCFYVKCNENENITYSTTNKDIIRLK